MKIQPFGELLQEIRKDRNISMSELAKAAEKNPAHLSRLVRGKSGIPTRDTVYKLARALCKNQQPGQSDFESVERRLLEASGHRQNREELIDELTDDLSDRFSKRLREEGIPGDKIDEVVARVPLATMRNVLLGEEDLEVGNMADYPPELIQTRKDAGEEVKMFDFLPTRNVLASEIPPASVGETATSYLDRHAEDFDRHAEDFVTRRREQRARSIRGPQKIIRAGREAEIHVNRSMSREQAQQLRLIAKLITTILGEKTI